MNLKVRYFSKYNSFIKKLMQIKITRATPPPPRLVSLIELLLNIIYTKSLLIYFVIIFTMPSVSNFLPCKEIREPMA